MKPPKLLLSLLLLTPLVALPQRVSPVPLSALDDVDGATVALEDYRVVGDSLTSYRAADGVTATKTGAAMRDVPFVLSVVPRQVLEDRRIVVVTEALDNVAGTQRRSSTYTGGTNFGAMVRGFNTGNTTLRNGFRNFEFYSLRDPANIERVEVLKGPASILYGNLQPGGVINTLSKRPTEQPLYRAGIVVGDFDFYRGEVDLGGRLSDRVGYRLNLAAEHAQSYRDHVGNRSQFIAPVFTWTLSERTRVTFEVEYKHADYVWDPGLPRDPISLTLPHSRFLGLPGYRNDVQSAFAAVAIEHQINPSWALRQSLSASYSGGDYFMGGLASSLNPDGRTVNYGARVAAEEHSGDYGVQHELVGKFETGHVAHQAVIGVDLQMTHWDYLFLSAAVPAAPIDIFEPVYTFPSAATNPISHTNRPTKSVGVYVQDLVALRDNLKLLLGARYDSVQSKTHNVLTRKLMRTGTDAKVVPQVGLIYQPTLTTSLYASYSTSFNPITSGVMKDGSFLDPEEGEQVEVGAKQEFWGGRASATFAAFWITKQNVSTPDPTDNSFRVQTGEQTSEGYEVELSGELLPGWQVIAAGAYIDAYVSRDNTMPIGDRLASVPDWSGSLWSKYTLQSGSLKGLSIGVGTYSMAKVRVALPNPDWWMPSYKRFDAMLSYAWEKWQVQLNVKNLTDEKIFTGSIKPEAPRTWLFSAKYVF